MITGSPSSKASSRWPTREVNCESRGEGSSHLVDDLAEDELSQSRQVSAGFRQFSYSQEIPAPDTHETRPAETSQVVEE